MDYFSDPYFLLGFAALYIGPIIGGFVQCMKNKRNTLLSLIFSILVVSIVWAAFGLWLTSLIGIWESIKPYGFSNWIAVPIYILLTAVSTAVMYFVIVSSYAFYDNYQDLGVFSFKFDHKKRMTAEKEK